MNSFETNKFIYDKSDIKLLTLKNMFHYVFIVLYHILIISIITFLCYYGVKGKLTSLCILYSCLSIILSIFLIRPVIIELLKTNKMLVKIKKMGYCTSEFKNPVIVTEKKINPLTMASLFILFLFTAIIIYSIIQYVNNPSNVEKLNIILLLTNVFITIISSFVSSVINDNIYAKQYKMQNKKI